MCPYIIFSKQTLILAKSQRRLKGYTHWYTLLSFPRIFCQPLKDWGSFGGISAAAAAVWGITALRQKWVDFAHQSCTLSLKLSGPFFHLTEEEPRDPQKEAFRTWKTNRVPLQPVCTEKECTCVFWNKGAKCLIYYGWIHLPLNKTLTEP